MPTPIQGQDATRGTTLVAETPGSAEAALPSQEEIQAKFDAATREGVSPCMWIPPEWSELKPHETKPGKAFPDNCNDIGDFGTDADEKIALMLDGGKKKDDKKPAKQPESPPDDDSWPHPFGDTSHVDETEFSHADHETLESKLSGAEDLLSKLNGIVGESSPGMRRIKGIYNWVLYRTTQLMYDLNQGLKNEEQYEDARTSYIEFLRDLDDHEPEKGTKHSPRDIAKEIALEKAVQIKEKPATEIIAILQPVIADRLASKLGVDRAKRRAKVLSKELGKLLENKTIEEVMESAEPKLDMTDKQAASGYGRAIKWACIDPVIFHGNILGTRVVAKWNPHDCSSGIPIPHKP